MEDFNKLVSSLLMALRREEVFGTPPKLIQFPSKRREKFLFRDNLFEGNVNKSILNNINSNDEEA